MSHDAKPRRTRRLLILAITLPTAVYLVCAIHFLRQRPGIDRDYYAEHNAHHALLADDDKAWAIYQQVQSDWHVLASALNEEVFARAAAFNDEQTRREANDHRYDRPPNPFDHPGNPFGIPPDNPLYAEAIAVLDAFQPGLHAVRQAATRSVIGITVTDRWNGDPWQAGNALDPSPNQLARLPLLSVTVHKVAPVGFLRHLLLFDSTIAAVDGDTDRVDANLRAALDIARQLRAEGSTIDQLLAARFLAVACEIAAISVSLPDTTDRFLAQESLLWKASEHHAQLDLTYDRRVADELIDRTYSGNPSANGRITVDGINLYHTMMGESPPPRWLLAALWPVRHGFATRSEVAKSLADGFEAVTDLSESGATGYPDFVRTLTRIEAAEHRQRHVFHAADMIQPLGGASLALLQSRTQLRAAASRLALERFKLAEGRYPDALAELIPSYIPELPEDPFNPGHPIKYLLRDAEPVLYSVGANAVDDHATPAPPNTRPDDLKARFADPGGPAPDAPKGDWILVPSP